MTLIDSLRALAATGCGLQLGAFLLMSLFHKPLFFQWPGNPELLTYFQRFYRMNTIIAVTSGILAILAGYRQTGFLLAILGMTYILLLTQLLPAILNTHTNVGTTNATLRRSPTEIRQLLKFLQNLSHLSQILLLLYLISRLLMANN